MTTTTDTKIAAAEATLIAADKALDEALAAWQSQLDVEHGDGGAAAEFFEASDKLRALQTIVAARIIEAHEAYEALYEALGW